MDSRIFRIISHFTITTDSTFIGVGAANGSLNHFRFDNISVDTLHIIEPSNRGVVYLYSDSTDSYRLRFIVTNNIELITEIGILAEEVRRQKISDDFIAIFLTPCITEKNDWRFHENNLSNAMIRTSLLACMYLAKQNPSQNSTFTTANSPQRQIKISNWDKPYSLGSVEIINENSYVLFLDCTKKASQEEVWHIIKYCFGNFAKVKNVQGYDSPMLGFSLEFLAELT